jgi:hypothetical protein
MFGGLIMNEKYLKVIELLGESIISKELSISLLEYEIKSLKSTIKSMEEELFFYKKDCENSNN